jgi:hypothetical protein
MKKALLTAAAVALALSQAAAAATPPLVKEEVDRVVASFLPPA